jgi:hypothetical protein
MMMIKKKAMVLAARNNVETSRLNFLLALKYANNFQMDRMALQAVMMLSVADNVPENQ